jgi:putative restriction endonuclease
MTGWLANTDADWFRFLRGLPEVEEVNFWQPSGGRSFHVLKPGEPLLFKLKAPHNVIAGFGHFVRHSVLPAWLAWDTFGIANGAPEYSMMKARIEHYRRGRPLGSSGSDAVGCLILAQPLFFPEELWIPQPADWPRSAVQGKSYDLDQGEGLRLWQACLAAASAMSKVIQLPVGRESEGRYGPPQLIAPRLGQGSFRIVVLESYRRACAISTEHSLPALEAAHIKPFAEGGQHEVGNGLLLRSDIHRLFDKGYLTITASHHIEVSNRLREDFSNGSSYYPFHGRRIALPARSGEHPDPGMLRWHNENRYLG